MIYIIRTAGVGPVGLTAEEFTEWCAAPDHAQSAFDVETAESAEDHDCPIPATPFDVTAWGLAL